jgi:hypothetical protein
MRTQAIRVAAALTALGAVTSVLSAGQISGELKTWHKVTITFDGPQTSETADPNPFTDYRLDVTFSKGDKRYVVPGYYAADGNAAETSADSGNKWRVHFAPCEPGRWDYRVSFRTGTHVAVSEDPRAGRSAGFMDGRTGSFVVQRSDKTGRDLRGRGRLQYVGGHFLRFAGTGEYFLKAGADAPENLLAYEDFDDTPNKGNRRKSWAPHAHDFDPSASDLLWGPHRDKGKNLLGAIRYLSDKGMNAFSFLTFNVDGDDQNVFPHLFLKDMADYESSTGTAEKGNGWSDHVHHTRFNVSKMDQWERVFEYGDRMGMYLHFKMLETENDSKMDGGELGIERKVYTRELIARYAHHLALNWNMGEETKLKTEQIRDWSRYIRATDPYGHLVVIHTYPGQYEQVYGPLLGEETLTGASIQTNRADFSRVHDVMKEWVRRSAEAGKPWVVACDEPGDAQHALITDAEDPTHDNARKNALWGVFMAGGAGIEWYFGYAHPHSDLTCQDWRTRDKMWDQSRYCIEFFKRHEIPFWEMTNANDLTRNPDDYCFIKPGEVYLIYFKNPGELKLSLESGAFTYGWFDPQTGNGLDGLLEPGKAAVPGLVTLKTPGEGDWLLCLRKTGRTALSFKDITEIRTVAVAVDEAPRSPYALIAVRDFESVQGGDFVPFYKDGGRRALAINAAQHKDKFSAARIVFAGETGTYDITLATLTETDGESTYRLRIGGKEIGTYTNPATEDDYQPAGHTWRNVAVKKGDAIQVEFNSASNRKIPEGSGFAYARGRWTRLSFVPTGGADAIFEERNGLVAGEAELFSGQTHTEKRRWYITTPELTPAVEGGEGRGNHAASASGHAYIQILPDTRRSHADKLIVGENFSNEPGQMAVVSYKVYFNTPGRYYVWVRAYSTDSEDNGLHVGLNGAWPESGRRLQWCDGKNTWRWESKQRTEAQHCGEPYKIYLDIEKPGLHTISFSMREDGFRFDKWLMSTDREMPRPTDEGPAVRFRRAGGAS